MSENYTVLNCRCLACLAVNKLWRSDGEQGTFNISWFCWTLGYIALKLLRWLIWLLECGLRLVMVKLCYKGKGLISQNKVTPRHNFYLQTPKSCHTTGVINRHIGRQICRYHGVLDFVCAIVWPSCYKTAPPPGVRVLPNTCGLWVWFVHN